LQRKTRAAKTKAGHNNSKRCKRNARPISWKNSASQNQGRVRRLRIARSDMTQRHTMRVNVRQNPISLHACGARQKPPLKSLEAA